MKIKVKNQKLKMMNKTKHKIRKRRNLERLKKNKHEERKEKK